MELAPFSQALETRSLRRYVAQWLLNYCPATREAYGRDIVDFSVFCERNGIDPLEAHRTVIAAYARDLTENRGYAAASTARHLAAVSSFYTWLTEEGAIVGNPASSVRRPRVSDESTSLGLSAEEARNLLTAAAAEDPQTYAFVNLLVHTGLRVSEAVGLKKSDFGTERGHIFCTVTRKGGKTQRVPLPWDVWEPLESLLEASESPWAFRGHQGGHLHRGSAWRLVRRLSDKAGVKAGPHSLRHTFVTLCLEAGVPLHEVQDAAGHADPRTTRRYDRQRNRMTHAPAYRLASFLQDD